MINKESIEQELSLIFTKYQMLFKNGIESARALSDLLSRGGYAGFVPNANFTSYFEGNFASIQNTITNMMENLSSNDLEYARTLCRKLCEELSHSVRDCQSVLIRIEANISDKPILIQLEDIKNITREFKSMEILLDRMIPSFNQLIG